MLTISQLMVLTPILYAVCTAFSKMSLVIFYRKLSPQTWWKWCVYGAFFFVAAYNAAILLATIFGCRPFKKGWDVTVVEGSCIDRAVLYMCTAALGIASDLLLLIMPIPMIVRLQMPSRQKIGLIILFAVGSA